MGVEGVSDGWLWFLECHTTCFIARHETCRFFLPHDPGHQHHGGLVEGVEELDEDLALLAQLPQCHAEHDGKHNQAQDVHAVLVCSERHLGETCAKLNEDT